MTLDGDGIGWGTHEVITLWPPMPNLIQLIQGTQNKSYQLR
jgi:hypothetical protein